MGLLPFICYRLVFWCCLFTSLVFALNSALIFFSFFSTERKSLPRASPDSPRLHRPDHLWSGRRTTPSPVSFHVHSHPLRPPAARLHHGSAAFTHGHPVARFPSGPAGCQTADWRSPPHSLTSRWSRTRGWRGGWVLVFQTSHSEETKASGTAYTWTCQTLRVSVRGLSGRAPLPKAGKNSFTRLPLPPLPLQWTCMWPGTHTWTATDHSFTQPPTAPAARSHSKLQFSIRWNLVFMIWELFIWSGPLTFNPRYVIMHESCWLEQKLTTLPAPPLTIPHSVPNSIH